MIDGSCYREGRNWKIFVIFGWHCLCFYVLFLFLLSFIFPHFTHFPLFLSSGKCWQGRLQKNQKKTKKKQIIEIMKDWRGCFFSFLSIWPGVPCMSFFLSFAYSLCSLHTTHPLHLLFLISFHFSMSYCFYFLSILISISYDSPFFLSSLHHSNRAQRVSSGLLVYVILFFNWELQWTWSYILISSKWSINSVFSYKKGYVDTSNISTP